jgi:hypothetical protein
LPSIVNMNDEDQEYISESLDEEDTNTLLAKVTRIEKGVEEIYKLLKANGSSKPTDKVCSEHGEPMQSAVSKKTGKPYGFHRNAEGQICFGRGYQA